MKCAVITIAVGDSYLKTYNQLFRKNTENYCAKYGYDFFVISDYIFEDEKYKKPVFIDIMKWTVPFYPEYQKYDRIAVVDADMLITPDCPRLESIDLQGKIGIVNEFSQPSYEIRNKIQIHNNWADTTPSEYYKTHLDVDIETNMLFNGGFYVLEPKVHAEWFRTIFNKHVDGTLTAKWHPFHYEQASLGLELIKANNYHVLDNRWNVIWPIVSHSLAIGNRNRNEFHIETYCNSYIVHYCSKNGWDLADFVRDR